MNEKDIRPLEWIGSSYKDLKEFPDDVQDLMGYALWVAQQGRKHERAKPLKGFGSGVLEIVANDNGDTYRAVYVVRLTHAVYVLHSFQKKSKHGIKTPQKEIDLIKQRLKEALERDQQKSEE